MWKKLFQRIHLCLVEGFGQVLFLIVQQVMKYTEDRKALAKRRMVMLKQRTVQDWSNIKGTTREEKEEDWMNVIQGKCYIPSVLYSLNKF